MFATSFQGGVSGIPFATPYVASFCSHQNSSEYTKENGLLSQWRAYGGTDSYAIVFDATGIEALLELEAKRKWYSFGQINRVIYNTDDGHAGETIKLMIDRIVGAWRAGKINSDDFSIEEFIVFFL
jgi:hypothetical protein